MGQTLDRQKLQELVLYVAEMSRDDLHFGLTKLNKILYFSDFKAYGILGASITGETYLRFDQGPVARNLLRELGSLEDQGAVIRYERMYFNYPQKRVEPVPGGRRADLQVFDPRELEIVDLILGELRHMNASQVSALSHLEYGWQLMASGEEIPYSTVYLSDRGPTISEVDQAADWLASGDTDDDELPVAEGS